MSNASGQIAFVDTTLRDGSQALWSMGMRTRMILPILPVIDEIGYDAVEIMAVAEFKKCIRDLKEDPWERIREIHRRLKKTPTRFIRGRNFGVFQALPESVEDLWTERLAANGVAQFRISDSSNTPSVWEKQIAVTRRHGIKAIINLIFTVSPKHTDEYYAERTRRAAALKPDRLCIKDPGALITPDRVAALVPAVLSNAGGIPVEFHTHCLTGLGTLCNVEAMRQGIYCINVATPPLAHGASNPSVYSTVRNARALGFEPRIDETLLPKVEEHFLDVARRNDFPVGQPMDYDHAQFHHQVPGGMISNFCHHLSLVGMLDRLPEVLDETAQVRADLGYPIMVTPYSQFVGTQAAMNVISGERYKVITDEVIAYALGQWGEEEATGIDPNVRDRILASPRARELVARGERPQPSIAEVRRQYGGPGITDEELLLRIATDKGSVDRMHATSASAVGDTASIARLIERLGTVKTARHIYMRREGMSLTLSRG